MVLSEGDTQREIEMIDTLAQKYYDYICQYGELPHGNATFSSQRVAISSLSYVITEQSDINYDTYKVNGQPVGGIRLISTITRMDAQSIIIKNDKYGEDVYCLIKKTHSL